MEPEPQLAATAAAGIRDARLLHAMCAIPRARFVPAEHVDLAPLDEPIPIGHHQVTTQPSLVAAMIETLDLRRDQIVLEAGTGFATRRRCLARLVGFVLEHRVVA